MFQHVQNFQFSKKNLLGFTRSDFRASACLKWGKKKKLTILDSGEESTLW